MNQWPLVGMRLQHLPDEQPFRIHVSWRCRRCCLYLSNSLSHRCPILPNPYSRLLDRLFEPRDYSSYCAPKEEPTSGCKRLDSAKRRRLLALHRTPSHTFPFSGLTSFPSYIHSYCLRRRADKNSALFGGIVVSYVWNKVIVANRKRSQLSRSPQIPSRPAIQIGEIPGRQQQEIMIMRRQSTDPAYDRITCCKNPSHLFDLGNNVIGLLAFLTVASH